jgi:hypothetical protein
MASAADIGANASNYQGNAGLGGGSFGSFQLDTKPIEDLAKYTMLYNKSLFDQRQKDAEAAANEIADVTSYDLTTGIPKDAKLLQDKYDKLTAYVRDNPNALDYRNKKEWAAYKTMRNDLDNDLKGAKLRNTMWALRQKEIQDEKNTARKTDLQRLLDEEINATDIRTPLKYSEQFDVEPVKYVAPKKLSFTVSKEYPNYIAGTDVLTTDMADVSNQSNAIIMGLSKFMTPQTATEKEQFKAQVNTGKLEPILSAQNLSSVMAGYVQNGVFDIDAAKKSGNTILSGNIANIETYNRKMEDMISAIKAGAFKDKLSGGVAAFGVNGLNEADYQKIDLNKGYITPQEYAKLGIMGLAEPTVTSKTEIKPTDNAIQMAEVKVSQRKVAVDEGQLKLAQEKWTTSMTGGETVKNGAFERAKRIYSDLAKLADANGVISPVKLRQLNVEQLKYLGVEYPEQRSEDGAIISSGGFKPLDLSGDREYAIQLTDGNIQVMAPKGKSKSLEKTNNGIYIGHWDNTKSTNIFNVATNILNEELKTSGSKELNSYMGIDLGVGGVTTNVVGGSQTQSGSTTAPPGKKLVYKGLDKNNKPILVYE